MINPFNGLLGSWLKRKTENECLAWPTGTPASHAGVSEFESQLLTPASYQCGSWEPAAMAQAIQLLRPPLGDLTALQIPSFAPGVTSDIWGVDQWIGVSSLPLK